jgi:hypothetical protein
MSNTPESQVSSEKWLDVVRAKVGLIRYGSVLITVHDGRVTQVELIERTRIGTDEEEVVRMDAKPVTRQAFSPRPGGRQWKP